MSTDECDGGFSVVQRKRFLDDKLSAALDRIECDAVLRIANLEGLERCPFCPFAAEYPPVEEDREFRCVGDDCGLVSCRLCKEPSHLPKTCEEVLKEKSKEKGLSARRHIEEAMSRAMIRNCNKCGTPFIKEHGCNKMTCTRSGCRNVQCYVCSKSCSYDHFDDVSRGGKKGNCPLFDDHEQRHREEVEKAGKATREKLAAEDPELVEEHLRFNMSSKVTQDEERRSKHARHHAGIPDPPVDRANAWVPAPGQAPGPGHPMYPQLPARPPLGFHAYGLGPAQPFPPAHGMQFEMPRHPQHPQLFPWMDFGDMPAQPAQIIGAEHMDAVHVAPAQLALPGRPAAPPMQAAAQRHPIHPAALRQAVALGRAVPPNVPALPISDVLKQRPAYRKAAPPKEAGQHAQQQFMGNPDFLLDFPEHVMAFVNAPRGPENAPDRGARQNGRERAPELPIHPQHEQAAPDLFLDPWRPDNLLPPDVPGVVPRNNW